MAKKAASSPRTRGRKSDAGAAAGDGVAVQTTAGDPASATRGRSAGGGGPRGGRSGGGGSRGRGQSYTAGAAKNRHLVIVESPAKAKTINKYLGQDYLVLASVGHVRDLPSKNPKGVKSPVPGVDLEQNFRPTYEVLEAKERVISDLKRAAKDSLSTGNEIWFATDLDREGEAIAWHLAQVLGISSKEAKRVIFAAITKGEIEKAFRNPHPIDEDRVNAQQARRIVDRIVGYQVSPLLWKKVARGLSAGRVQSVAVRLVVEREREIRAFVPDEYWQIEACFTPEIAKAPGLASAWRAFLAQRDEKNNPPTVKAGNAWLAERGGIRAELVEVDGAKFDLSTPAASVGAGDDIAALGRTMAERCAAVARAAGLQNVRIDVREEPKAKGLAKFVRTVRGEVNPAAAYRVRSITTKRTTTRPPPPYITSTLQQAASSRLGFGAQRTMRTAQQLYEGVDIPGEGPVGLITYMRTDSTHLSGDALNMARNYIERSFGARYLPEKPNFFSSSNKAAQEAHEAIRPTSLEYPPNSPKIRNTLNSDQLRLYTIIWERFVACQMTPAEWDATTVLIDSQQTGPTLTFKATGRVLVFDGFYRVAGVPTMSDEQTLPPLAERQPLAPFDLEATQKFTSPPPRYSEASLIKMLESEGIGRPSTYAAIIGVIQDRKYVEQRERRFYATDLGEVVTDKLIEAFPEIMDVGYTREMETQLDKVEEDHLDWIDMLRRFYGPFKKSLAAAEKTLTHAKAEVVPAPPEYTCPQCEKEGRGKSATVYRFGKNGRFLSCSLYPTCNWASPVDREGVPRPAAEGVDVACPKCSSVMTKRVGRFGPFLGCSRYGDKSQPCDGILNLDKKGRVVAPSMPPLKTELPCPTCQSPLLLRSGARGPWLSCSRFPKCRGRGKWNEVDEAGRTKLEAELKEHERTHPVPIIRTLSGRALTDGMGKPTQDAPMVDQLSLDGGGGSSAANTDPGSDAALETASSDSDAG
ncbi:MAG: DNA topoisomerase [Planctomycetota bacterium]|nr:DNA topoisomerase [Planctomycetota bacterium]